MHFDINPPIDSEALNRFFASAWPEHSSVDFEKLLSKSLLYVLCRHDEKIIGFVKIISDGGVHGFLLDPTVSPEFRRQGIGTRLVKQAVEAGKHHGLKWIHIDYEPHLAEFYSCCGFRSSSAGVLQL